MRRGALRLLLASVLAVARVLMLEPAALAEGMWVP